MAVLSRLTTFVLATFLSLQSFIYNCCAQNITAEKSFEKQAYQLANSWYAGDRNACQQFAELIASDPNSIRYSFQDLLDDGIIHIITSDDQRLRYYYTWNRDFDGMNPTAQIVQYVINGRCEVLCSLDEARICPFIESITSFIDKGVNYYIVRERMKLSYSPKQVATSLSIVRLGEKGLAVVDELSIGDSFYNLADWLIVQDPDELCFDASNIVGLNSSSNSISLPESIHGPEWDSLSLNILSGKYSLYRIYDGKIECVKTGLVNKLNPVLCSFANVELTFKTKSFIIRVDRMPDGSYRYASWRSSQSTEDSPRLVLDNGYYDEQHDKYYFSNKGYYYIVGADRTGGNHYIEVLKGNKLVLRNTRRAGNE